MYKLWRHLNIFTKLHFIDLRTGNYRLLHEHTGLKKYNIFFKSEMYKHKKCQINSIYLWYSLIMLQKQHSIKTVTWKNVQKKYKRPQYRCSCGYSHGCGLKATGCTEDFRQLVPDSLSNIIHNSTAWRNTEFRQPFYRSNFRSCTQCYDLWKPAN